MAINAIKEDIVKIENQCTKKIRLGYRLYVVLLELKMLSRR